jgi:MFS family permease
MRYQQAPHPHGRQPQRRIGVFEWYRELGTGGRRTFWACFGGYALDALDVQIYSMAIPVLIGIGFITSSQAGLIATSTLVLSAVGGWAAGILADRLGRVRTLQLTVLWFAVFTALCGLTTGFWSLLVCRACKAWGSAANGRRARC